MQTVEIKRMQHYARLITSKKIKIKLLTSTPGKLLTIPRLELLSCLLISKLIKTIYKSVKHEITIAGTTTKTGKLLTIPRLELLSCLLISKLIKTIYKSIKHEITVAGTTCWTDSKVAFFWITQKYKDWEPWVQNRVNRIMKLRQCGNMFQVP